MKSDLSTPRSGFSIGLKYSSTRFAVVTSGPSSVVAAGKTDPRFAHDADYPNQWRPLLRDEQAEIKPGPAHLLAPAGGYAKITRLAEPADAVLIECHLVYEEPHGWFEGQSGQTEGPTWSMKRSRAFRRKLAVVAAEGREKKPEAVADKGTRVGNDGVE